MAVVLIFLQGDDAQNPARRKPLVSLAKEQFGDYFRLVRRALAAAADNLVAKAALVSRALLRCRCLVCACAPANCFLPCWPQLTRLYVCNLEWLHLDPHRFLWPRRR